MRSSALALLALMIALCSCQSDRTNVAPPTGASGDAGNSIPPGHMMAQKATSGPGILLGSWAGSDIVASMDQNDRLKNQQAETRAFTAPIGQLVTWKNPDDQQSGTLTALRDSYNAQGAYCRDFQQTVTVGGQQKQGYPKACQIADGSWRIVKEGK